MSENVLVNNDHSLSKGRTRSLNMAVGGQQGALSDPRQWMSSATYVRQKLIPVLVHAPGLMKIMPDGQDRIRQLKALVELLPTSITGLNDRLDVTYEEHRVSNGGEFHETPTNVERVRSVPVFEYPEKEGKAIKNFYYDWIRYLIADPETMHPLLATTAEYESAGKPEFLPDGIAMAVLFIEPSRDLRRVTSAWLTANMMPKTSGDDEGKRVIGEGNEIVTQSIEFTGTTMVGNEVIRMAQDYLDTLNKEGFRPAALPGFYDAIDADVTAGGEDFANKLEAVASSAGQDIANSP